jgi:subtilase family serine protease/C1A family cysteine protease
MKLNRIASAVLITVLMLSALALVPTPSMAQKQLPDLVVPDVWLVDSQICYYLKNIGEGSIPGAVAQPSYYSSLFIDGEPVAVDQVNVALTPGQQLNRCFKYQWQATLGNHTIEVCADGGNDITESNEKNNCLEEVWVIEEETLPDLIVEKIECSPDNKLSVTIKNIGSGNLPSGWIALAETYFDGVRKGAFDLKYPTSILNGGISKSGGSSTYLVSWDITAPVTVKVIADYTDDIDESNEKNNSKEEDIQPTVIDLPDLEINDVWGYGSTSGVYTEIRYIIRNSGDGSAGTSTTALYIDGTKVGEHLAAGLSSGEWRVEQYSYEGECSGASDEFSATADFYDALEESDETNNTYSRTYSCPAEIDKPNLEMSDVWHEGEEEYYYANRQYTEENNIRFLVKSTGDADSPTTEARLYVDGTWFSTHSIPSLTSGDQYEGGFNYIGSCSGDYDTIRVVVDPTNLIAELDETDNELTEQWDCYVVPPPGENPDLIIQRVWLEPLGDSNYKIGYEIQNEGPGYAPNSNTGLYVDDVFKAVDGVARLAPGEARDEEFWWPYDLSSCTPLLDNISVIADYDYGIEEISETNNKDTLTLDCPEVPAPPIEKPDLVILNVWYESDPGPFPENLYIRYSIQNQGTAPAGPSVTRLYINYSEIDTSSVPALDIGEVIGMITFSERWTPQWDDNHVQICADSNNDVDEITPAPSGELNNCLEADWAFQPSCCDGVQNRDEEAIDCGGSYCPPCNRCDLTTLPYRFDWRDYYALPAVRNQSFPQPCGSCWAHAAIGAIEGTYIAECGVITNLSEQYAICEVKGDCSGGCPHDVLKYARNTGIVDETCQPYLASNSPCNMCSDWRDRLWTIQEYHRVSNNIEAIKRALICHGPLSVGSENWEHAIVVVGYDDSLSYPVYRDGELVGVYGPGCWIIRNSWGAFWGDDLDNDGIVDDPGYGLIPYSGHSHSDIKKYVHYVSGVLPP